MSLLAKAIFSFSFLTLFAGMIFQLLLVIGQKANEKHYATSIAAIVKLLNIEETLLTNFFEYFDLSQEKLKLLQVDLEKVRQQHKKAAIDPESYLSIPINSFGLLRRLHSDWMKWQTYLNRQLGSHIGLVEEMQALLPTSNDLDEAAEGIFRIQSTYLLKPADMANGLLWRKKYDAKFTALDCFQMGEYSISRERRSNAINWFQLALALITNENFKSYKNLGLRRAHIWFRLAECYKFENRYHEALEAIDFSLRYKRNDAKYLKLKTFLEDLMSSRKTCRDKLMRPSRLHCRYKSRTTPFLKLAPLKMEELNLDPYIVLYHNVIYDGEIEQIKEMARSKMNELIEERFTHGANFLEPEIIAQRVMDISGLSLEGADLFQVTNYGTGGHHFNHDNYYNYTGDRPSKIAHRGDRIADVLFYLNDVEQGGGTIFPRIQLAVPAKKGNALLVHHLDETGQGNRNSMHASCTVLVGSKWVGIKMLYERAQMFKRPCYPKEKKGKHKIR